MPKVKIELPKKKANPSRMPPKFVATGTVRGKQAKTVKGVLVMVADATKTVLGKLVSFKPVVAAGKPNIRRYRWVIFIDASAAAVDQEYDLTVKPVRQDGTDDPDGEDKVRIRLVARRDGTPAAPAGVLARGTAAPVVQFPPEEYEISGPERDVFFAFGDSTLDITSVTLGGRDADFARWLPDPDYYWWAEFYSLGANPGEGDYDILVVNADGVEPTEVTIEAS